MWDFHPSGSITFRTQSSRLRTASGEMLKIISQRFLWYICLCENWLFNEMRRKLFGCHYTRNILFSWPGINRRLEYSWPTIPTYFRWPAGQSFNSSIFTRLLSQWADHHRGPKFFRLAKICQCVPYSICLLSCCPRLSSSFFSSLISVRETAMDGFSNSWIHAPHYFRIS